MSTNEYAFEHEGRQFVSSGAASGIDNVTEHNAGVEAREIASFKTGPERLFLYVKRDGLDYTICTWLGTVVSDRASCAVGQRVQVGFGYHTYRRSVDCVIFGTRYVGWYMESSGDYCRLRKAKRQGDIRKGTYLG